MEEKQQPVSFETLIQTSEVPVFVDFWAEWCAPCHMVAPSVKQLSQEFKGKLKVIKVNVDKQPHIASKYGIQGIPTLMLFHKGKILWRVSGALPYPAIKAEVEKFIR
ncbi:MAG: thioredoxin [Calditrichaeota bacterium]|nr:MAG: thioredoxin [Calditrichota bacterium]